MRLKPHLPLIFLKNIVDEEDFRKYKERQKGRIQKGD